MPFAAGTYTLTFNAAQRGNVASAQTFQVLVDGAVVGTFNNLTGSAYSSLATSTLPWQPARTRLRSRART